MAGVDLPALVATELGAKFRAVPASLSRVPGLLEYGGIALMVIAPFVFFPFPKTLFLAFDLLFRPDAREAR